MPKKFIISIGFYFLINLEISINFIYSKQKPQMQYLNIRIWQGMHLCNNVLTKFLFLPDVFKVQT